MLGRKGGDFLRRREGSSGLLGLREQGWKAGPLDLNEEVGV